MVRHRALFLPGSILPAAPAYAGLLEALGDDVDARVKDLEVYATPTPPAEYSLEMEVEGIVRAAGETGFERFHLAGYSGGGAASLAFAARHPERLLSLAIMEPAFAGWGAMTPEERSVWNAFHALLDSDRPDMMARFQALQLAPGVQPTPPPPGPPPAWMSQRPAGVRAFLRAFFATDLAFDTLRRFDRPVWFALGGRSNPDYFRRMADRLALVFPDFTLEVFPDRHHFDPPHRIEPAHVAASLRSLWDRAESGPST
jgi:pimeloyl-ACP methyl ester carboxylesterase